MQIAATIACSSPAVSLLVNGIHFSGQTRTELQARLLPAFLLTVIFALVARRLRSVTLGGAIAGSVMSLAIYVGSGPAGFAVLATVFFLTAFATRIGLSRKRTLGAAENTQGRRAPQVLANLAVAATVAVSGGIGLGPSMFTCMVAALAEATADTVSSECGQAWGDRVYMITSFRRVPVGTDGGISVPGTLAGLCGACIIAIVSSRLHLVPFHAAVLAGTAGVLGMFVDSLLGAVFERRRWLGNNRVNFLSTLVAAALAFAFLL